MEGILRIKRSFVVLQKWLRKIIAKINQQVVQINTDHQQPELHFKR